MSPNFGYLAIIPIALIVSGPESQWASSFTSNRFPAHSRTRASIICFSNTPRPLSNKPHARSSQPSLYCVNAHHPRVSFVSPLLEDGYPPAVIEHELQATQNEPKNKKPLLLYLPGFDGTLVAPFVQFPSLGESFDVRGMRIGMDDRSTFEELTSIVIGYLSAQFARNRTAVYLMGESFGGILAIEVSRALRSNSEYTNISLNGLILINPATSYLRSNLYRVGPSVANPSSMFPPISFVQYVYSLSSRMVPLFLDNGRSFQQLILMLSAKGLPAVLNSPRREAYLGRVAFDLPNRLQFMPQETLKWRLDEWLERGCMTFEHYLQSSSQTNDHLIDGGTLFHGLKTLIVVGELDRTLPSVEEAHRLASSVFNDTMVHVVPNAGHASSCGGSLQLIQLMRSCFLELKGDDDDFYDEPQERLFGLVPRYDNSSIGMSPLRYWVEENYRKITTYMR